MALAEHPHAMWALFFVAIIESSFFLVPPDVLLIPIVLAARRRAWFAAGVCTLGSVIGGIIGYSIGIFAFEALGHPILEMYHALGKFEEMRGLYNEHGALIVFSAGFSPIPYKVFTITSGVADMNIITFTIASIFGRGARFFLVAGLIYAGGERFQTQLRRYVDGIGWAIVAIVVVGILFLYV